MSARQPFVPNGTRPASRAAQNQKSQTQFTVDPTNPLHMKNLEKDQANRASTKAYPAKSSSGNTASGGDNRPLNTSSLVKRKNQQQGENASRRPSVTGNVPIRPGTADPHSKEQVQALQRNHTIAAPIPRQAVRPSSPGLSSSLASGVFAGNTAQNMFRMPDLPPGDAQTPNDMHIASSALGFSFSNPNPRAASDTQKNQLPSPPTSIRAASTRPFVVPDPAVPIPPFALNMGMSGGAQRVILNPDGSRGPNFDQIADTEESLAVNGKGTMLLKRSRADMDVDMNPDSPTEYKRHRNQEAYREKSAAPLHSSPTNHSSHSRNHSHTPEIGAHGHHRPTSYEQHQLQHPLTPPGNDRRALEHYYNPQRHGADDGPSAIDKLLGCDVTAYIEEHADQYERAVERWKQCTMAEWIAGADGQS
ncbi:hypothetical protein H0H81_007106 [Sphagnurus paluster]|uniref:Uncharacterized protein n=1 Tax=Sphagnurus paluster TaxID=117069 RepID=A0A9P7FSY5_9AGAR|nr:hypothetical protein H0H81_007106 [Sphagnurus paluster]